MELKPSTFLEYPWNSVTNKSEAETIACNIMKIRARLGDAWPITWATYKSERKKDKGFTETERHRFDLVLPLIDGPEKAIQFSKTWADAAFKVRG